MRIAAALFIAQPHRGRRVSVRGRRPGHALAAWMAIFGLYLQLAAAALCLSGSPVAGSQVDAQVVFAGSPICHSQDNDRDNQGSGGGPGNAHGAGACAFCSLHGQVGLIAASPPQPAAPVIAAADSTEPPGFAAQPLSRRPTDAAPRGPPVIG